MRTHEIRSCSDQDVSQNQNSNSFRRNAPRIAGIVSSKYLRLLTLFFAMFFLIWAFLDSRFRDAEGFVAGGFCLPIAVGVALMIVAAGIAGRFRKFTFWFALALVGQAVSLQLIDAGRLIHYQHYKPLHRLLAETHPLILFFLVAQATLVVIGLRTYWPNIESGCVALSESGSSWAWASSSSSRAQRYRGHADLCKLNCCRDIRASRKPGKHHINSLDASQ